MAGDGGKRAFRRRAAADRPGQAILKDAPIVVLDEATAFWTRRMRRK